MNKEEVMWPDTKVGKIIGDVTTILLIGLGIFLMTLNLENGKGPWSSLLFFMYGLSSMAIDFSRARKRKIKKEFDYLYEQKTRAHSKAMIVSRVSMVVIFLALIRCIGEVFRLHNATPSLSYDTILPFLMGTMVCAVSLFFMTIFTFYKQYRSITMLAVLSIIFMLMLKYHYIV